LPKILECSHSCKNKVTCGHKCCKRHLRFQVNETATSHECKHSCKNKASCGHKCCKRHLPAKKSVAECAHKCKDKAKCGHACCKRHL